MQPTIARYSALALPGYNNSSKLNPDQNGYRKCILGGFNLYNHSGEYYPLTESVKGLFETGGIVRRRLDSGLCRGEYGHPKIQGMCLEAALNRLAVLDELLISHHIRDVDLVPSIDEYKNDIILAVGSVKPTGPFGDCLEKQMDNPDENVAFSIRSFTTKSMYNGKTAKIVRDAITWDYVNEPGIKAATQFNTAISLEELSNTLIFTDNDLDTAISESNFSGLESGHSALSMVRSSLGWAKVEILKVSAIDWK